MDRCQSELGKWGGSSSHISGTRFNTIWQSTSGPIQGRIDPIKLVVYTHILDLYLSTVEGNACHV